MHTVASDNIGTDGTGEYWKLTEGRDTGLLIIHRALEENGSPPPIFETDE